MSQYTDIRVAIVMILCGALAGLTGPAWAGLTYEGSVPIGAHLIPKAVKKFKEKTKIAFDAVYTHGSDQAMTAVLNEHIDLGGIARPLTAAEEKAHLNLAMIGRDPLVIFIHAQSSVSSLSTAQVRGIFSGELTRWQDVGGPDAPIHVVASQTTGRSVTREFLSLLDCPALAQSASLTTTPGEHLNQVAADPFAITFDSLTMAKPGLRAVAIDGIKPTREFVTMSIYKLSRPLYLITQRRPNRNTRRFMEYIQSSEGRALIDEVFYPVQ